MTVAALPAAVPVLAPTILDLEASGFGRGSYPIEIGTGTWPELARTMRSML